MNILYHHRTQGHGAEGVHITSIIQAFRKQGHEVVVCSPPGVDPFATAGGYLYGGKGPLIVRLWKSLSRHAPQALFEFMELSYNVVRRCALVKVLRSRAFEFVFE